jgi:hypothetical protein
MPTLPTQEEVQADFDAAMNAGVSPCMWIPPEWESLQSNGGVFRDNTSNDAFFNDQQLKDAWRAHLAECELKEQPRGPESLPDDRHWPNPFSDFSHTDPDEFHEIAEKLGNDPESVVRLLERPDVRACIPGTHTIENEAVTDAVDVLRGNGTGQQPGATAVAGVLENVDVKTFIMKKFQVSREVFDETVSLLKRVKAFPDRLTALNKLKAVVGPQSAGMQRLAQVFDWALCRTTELLYDLNEAVTDRSAYDQARSNYINFLKDLDDRHPEASDRPWNVKDKTFRSCYGRAVKWACLDPVILNGEIVGARVVIQWNPHSSSSGIPIPHAPY